MYLFLNRFTHLIKSFHDELITLTFTIMYIIFIYNIYLFFVTPSLPIYIYTKYYREKKKKKKSAAINTVLSNECTIVLYRGA